MQIVPSAQHDHLKKDGAHIIITGASSGLGWALAQRYAAPGRLLSLSSRDAARLEPIAKICREQGAIVAIDQLDVTHEAETMRWVTSRDAVAPVSLVIANAGFGGAGSMAGPSGESARRANEIMAVNVLGALNTVTPLVPKMVERGYGHIALIGSIGGNLGLPQSPVYSASKAAIRIYGDGLRRLLATQGVRVTTVIPGFMDTPMSRTLPGARPFLWSAQKAAARIERDIGIGRAYSAFPWPLHAVVGLHNLLPRALTDVFFRAVIQKNWPIADAAQSDDTE